MVVVCGPFKHFNKADFRTDQGLKYNDDICEDIKYVTGPDEYQLAFVNGM